MNRPFLHELAKRAGYSVHQRSTHGKQPAWDWGPKDPMLSRHFPNADDAWADLERVVHQKLVEADKLIRLGSAIIKEQEK